MAAADWPEVCGLYMAGSCATLIGCWAMFARAEEPLALSRPCTCFEEVDLMEMGGTCCEPLDASLLASVPGKAGILPDLKLFSPYRL